ncbi:12765_t:CDS:2, partial [Entrophospora sp. SA101]
EVIGKNMHYEPAARETEVYYTSSGGANLEVEKAQLQPFIEQICGEGTPIQIIQPADRESKGYECGVYLVKYLAEILETGFLELKRTYKRRKILTMPKYTTDYLYNEFSGLAGMRTDSKYANDAGFEKLESLDGEKIKAELNKCTSQGEYESKKADYIRKANEISSGLRARTGHSSSMFGVCIIWADQAMSPYIENKMQDGRRMLENLKSQLGMEKYQHIEELRILKLEQKKIEARMQENKRKAMNEKDPTKRAKFLQLIDEDSKKLEENLRKQNAIPTSPIKFNASKYVSEMIEGMKKAIERNNKGGSGSGGGEGDPDKPRKPKKPDDSSDDDDDKKGDGNNNDDDNKRPPRKKKQSEQNNQQMLLIAIAVIVVLFLLMNQKDPDRPRYRDYDEYAY